MVYFHNGIICSREKEGACTLCNGMDGTGEHYAKYHGFLIHSLTDGHLGCFQHLAIINCVAMNIGGEVLSDWCFRVLRI